MLGEGHVHHELALGRMTGNVPLARRILSQHDTPRGKSTDVTVACLKFNLAGSVRDCAIDLNLSTSASPSDNSIARRHAAIAFSPSSSMPPHT